MDRERILVIEDDRELGAQIVEQLARAGFEPIWWKEGAHVPPDVPRGLALVILDLMLPGLPGLDMLKELRALGEVPILVLSARNDTTDKVGALRLGADDYMTKPFWPEELLERVRARLRRPVLRAGDVIEAGPLRIALKTGEARAHGQLLSLTPSEFRILAELARRPGDAVRRGWLVDHALDADHDGGERTLDVHVSRLRKKLGDASLIETVWGIGYRLSPGRRS